MSFTDIIFWLFARLRPVLWHAHRLAGQRFEDVEPLARLRASHIRRLMHAAPIPLIAGHRSQAAQPGRLASSSFFFFFLVVFSCGGSPAPTGLPIRAPP